VSDGRATAAPTPSSPEARSSAQDDAQILAAVSGGELRRALSLCVAWHGAGIGRLCMAMLGSQVEADDMTQETLLAAHDGFATFRGESSVRAWLFGIARNKCLQQLEKARRRGARLRLVPLAHLAPADEVVGARQRAERARALLEEVRPSDRDALLMRYGADLSFKEVAAACGIDEPAARKRVSRALLRLRSMLKNEDAND
jgi:RNA polymerase sigma-70 factor, ECF subfamily